MREVCCICCSKLKVFSILTYVTPRRRVGILGEVQKIHIQYWKSPAIQKPPMSMSGAKFTVDDWRGKQNQLLLRNC